MKALICVLSALCLTVQSSVAANEAPELAEVREALARLEREPGSVREAFLSIFRLVEKAESYAMAGDSENARSRYAGVLAALQKLQKLIPEWNPAIIEYRTKKVQERLKALGGDGRKEPAPVLSQPNFVTLEPLPARTDWLPALPPALTRNPKDPIILRADKFLDEIEARNWIERNFKEKVHAVPLMITPEAAGF